MIWEAEDGTLEKEKEKNLVANHLIRKVLKLLIIWNIKMH
jgi:hypothetical protein